MSCDLLADPDQPLDVVIPTQCGALPTEPLGEDAISELLHDFLGDEAACSMGRQHSWELQLLPTLPAAPAGGTAYTQDPFDEILLDLLSPTEHAATDTEALDSMSAATTAEAAAAAFAVLLTEVKHEEAEETGFEDLLNSDAATAMTGSSLMPWELSQQHHQSSPQVPGMIPLPPCPQQAQPQHQHHQFTTCCDPSEWKEHTVRHGNDKRGAPIMVSQDVCGWYSPSETCVPCGAAPVPIAGARAGRHGLFNAALSSLLTLCYPDIPACVIPCLDPNRTLSSSPPQRPKSTCLRGACTCLPSG
jgi:hypothetical protein